MTAISLIKLLQRLAKDHNKKVFTLNELAILGNETVSSMGMSLIRAKKNDVVERVGNLWINMINPPTLEELALQLKSPSYISLENVLYQHGVLSQSPRGLLSLLTTLKPLKISTPLGDIRYVHISSRLFFGFDENRIATPEKAFLDLMYIRIRHGISDLPETFYLEQLNKKRLFGLAKKFPLYVQKAVVNLLKAGKH